MLLNVYACSYLYCTSYVPVKTYNLSPDLLVLCSMAASQLIVLCVGTHLLDQNNTLEYESQCNPPCDIWGISLLGLHAPINCAHVYVVGEG